MIVNFNAENFAVSRIHTSFNDDGTTVNLIPIFDHTSYNPSAGAVEVIGFAAFVIDTGGIVHWDGNSHVLQGHFVRYLTSGTSAGPGGTNNFGVYVVGLNG